MSESAVAPSGVNGVAHLAGKYLTFALAEEEYGVQILKVREIMGVMEVTPVPQTLPSVLGVINLRGKVIPVVDLRLKFSLPFRPPDERTCTIVLEVTSAQGSRLHMGMVVDAVREVVNVRTADVEITPSFGMELETDFMLGLAKMDNGVKILLDIDRILGQGQLVRS
jgi:purine-binding chemotaxis protein CheW